MSEDFKLDATARNDLGKGASRRLRRLADQVPAIIYGGSKAPVNVSVSHNELLKHLQHEAFFSHVIDLNIDGTSESVILKDVQRHPSKAQVLHLDFLRVDKNTKLHKQVPLHFINEATSVGVKTQGGKVVHNLTQLDVTCLPQDLPEFIEVDLAAIEAGQILHISDLKLPKGVISTDLTKGADHDLAVVTILKAKGGESEEAAE
ncbi:50S ribosomal protein L25/general stress protein Ctc [Cellvibrio japonicus]|uniref:Large ribosomal subunit protein bL25 n=1 Tax=Cellvibrio japonicus (strain Ueda107) TaxID=498211 RepID=RL25_CELJU|nr:50S ribosomal protein L25/general stress protein Ctc [Cellvibrio japonicus]B3PJN6.1 RecName: Full=Large ribosomal subunit protein bL25; AltName: Full=50S ribosomal protein L25; AltName: Full=General stress protein CTC [Cellvibrio japonicus Ueda107]ACE83686.1 ribosomal protein L25, Ctc-form [Cellvibrio japonicus Ueda107]QEI11319.1 50S ribosomal protein L25 [Cellvibrio japonicus]QEI14893.1 50S ribosomal protein L25 [Cellvibrio japonicus]QEI18473.1 50S ribosomal protein L25 [Cellvibrio japonic